MTGSDSGWGDLGFPRGANAAPTSAPDFYEAPEAPAPKEEPAAARAKGGPSQATELVLIARDTYSFVHGGDASVYAIAHDRPSRAIPMRGRAAFAQQLRADYMSMHGRSATGSAITDAIETLEGLALDGEQRQVALRVARVGMTVYVDLGWPDEQAVRIDGSGWQVVERAPVLFRRSRGIAPMSRPAADASLDELHELLNASEAHVRLIVGWIAAGFLEDIAHPILAVLGVQGTAKTTAARIVLELLDPSPATMRAQPRSEEDWSVWASSQWGIGIDNVSALTPIEQDMLCRAATGDAFVRRERYSDSDVSFMKFRRPIALTSIDPGALQGDIAERLLPITLLPIAPERRQLEREIVRRANDARGQILGAIFDLLAGILRELPSVHLAARPRMADFAEVLAALDKASGWSTLQDYLLAANEATLGVVDGDAFAIALGELLDQHEGDWEGTPAALLAIVTQDGPRAGLPKSPRAVTAKLARMTVGLTAAGIRIEQLPRSAAGARMRLFRINLHRCDVCGLPLAAVLVERGATAHPIHAQLDLEEASE